LFAVTLGKTKVGVAVMVGNNTTVRVDVAVGAEVAVGVAVDVSVRAMVAVKATAVRVTCPSVKGAQADTPRQIREMIGRAFIEMLLIG
jgi:transcriptional regulator of nitric oxide reductase